ncbi:subtilosin maturase AlbA [Bacillus atrophaeus]|uniref:subtilosin maturase AlbA n=1 Tax=Bacillus atrophaeus TaxID=1452 RepID=UPI00227E149C|nr:subtilosin maturase AlbA [Bacillus atrophaeus]MCY8512998.1 subtilosin maturase AlbA [Bacillus atrophaeus]MCY8992414.1 subtilosin maturase AlbA [Bacillus atrophaeus]
MLIERMFPFINESVRVHQLPEGGVLEIDYMRDNVSISDFEYLDLNKTAYELCMLMDGQKTAEQILEYQCATYNESPEDHKDWYYEMLDMLLKKQVIRLTDQPEYRRITTSGSSDFPMPLHATFELTHRCNLKCAHCYLESSPEALGTVSLEQFKKTADMLYEKGVLTCEITGGEIFVHPNANELLEYVLKKFKKVAVLTNGTLMRKESLEILKAYKQKIIVGISLDSVHSEVHDSFRGRKGSFAQTCKTIKLLSDHGIFVRVAMSVFEKNMWEIHDMAQKVRGLGAKAFSYNWVDDFGRGRDIVHPTKDAEQHRKFMEYEQNVIDEFKDLIPIIPYERKRAANCGAGWKSIVISPFGEVRPCALFPKEFSLGNIFHDSYESIFDSALVHKLWKAQAPRFSEHCKKDKCPFSGYCGGCYLKGLNSNKYHRKNICSWAKNEQLEDVVQLI